MKYALVTFALLASTSTPVLGEVKAESENGFNIIHVATVNATADEIWRRLLSPKDYWNKAHSWSGSAAGFYIDAQANGCFCELFQETDSNGKVKTVGSVEHMRVIFAQPGKVLRMQGALGPLQSEAVIGTITVAIAPTKESTGTTVNFSYVVGGYMRYKLPEIAPAVDKVLGEQFKNMLSPFAAKEDEAPKSDGFRLDVEKIADPAARDVGPSDAETSLDDASGDVLIPEAPPSEPR